MSGKIEQSIGCIALVVENYDDAIEFYTSKLRFTLVEDTELGGGKRWVQVSPPNSNGTNLLLAQASSDEQKNAVGNQTGGRVFLFLQTRACLSLRYEFCSNQRLSIREMSYAA